MVDSGISFRDAMRLLWSGERVSLTVCKLDQSKKTGGQLRTYENARLNISLEKQNRPTHEDKSDIQISDRSTQIYRPNQWINLILPNNELRKIYKVGITKINDQTVYI